MYNLCKKLSLSGGCRFVVVKLIVTRHLGDPKTDNVGLGWRDKTFFMLKSAEHEILNPRKYKSIKKLKILGSDKHRMLFFLVRKVKCQQLLAF